MTPLQNLPMNGGDLGKLIVANGFKKLPKFQKIAKYGHTDGYTLSHTYPCARASSWFTHCLQDDYLSVINDLRCMVLKT